MSMDSGTMKEKNMKGTEPKENTNRGRPVTRTIPEPIPDTPENIANACMENPPKKEWRYLKKKNRA